MISKGELLEALYEGRGCIGEILIDQAVLQALGFTAECLRGRYGLWDATKRRWYAMPRPSISLEDAVLLAERLGRSWRIEALFGSHARACIDGQWQTGRTPALALTRAIVSVAFQRRAA